MITAKDSSHADWRWGECRSGSALGCQVGSVRVHLYLITASAFSFIRLFHGFLFLGYLMSLRIYLLINLPRFMHEQLSFQIYHSSLLLTHFRAMF